MANYQQPGFCLDSFSGRKCGCRRISLRMRDGCLEAIIAVAGCLETRLELDNQDWMKVYPEPERSPRDRAG